MRVVSASRSSSGAVGGHARATSSANGCLVADQRLVGPALVAPVGAARLPLDDPAGDLGRQRRRRRAARPRAWSKSNAGHSGALCSSIRRAASASGSGGSHRVCGSPRGVVIAVADLVGRQQLRDQVVAAGRDHARPGWCPGRPSNSGARPARRTASVTTADAGRHEQEPGPQVQIGVGDGAVAPSISARARAVDPGQHPPRRSSGRRGRPASAGSSPASGVPASSASTDGPRRPRVDAPGGDQAVEELLGAAPVVRGPGGPASGRGPSPSRWSRNARTTASTGSSVTHVVLPSWLPARSASEWGTRGRRGPRRTATLTTRTYIWPTRLRRQPDLVGERGPGQRRRSGCRRRPAAPGRSAAPGPAGAARAAAASVRRPARGRARRTRRGRSTRAASSATTVTSSGSSAAVRSRPPPPGRPAQGRECLFPGDPDAQRLPRRAQLAPGRTPAAR